MDERDKAAAINELFWQRLVNEGQTFTRPWLDLDRGVLECYASGRLATVPQPLSQIYPSSVLADVAGKNVLCLASGGGQQSAVFGLLGAQVTVVDLAEGQLEGDRKAAEYYGYEVVTVQADMRNLSCLPTAFFDLVYQAPSMGYIPDVRSMYSEIFRVLRMGGVYRVEATNPATQFVDESWDGKGYRITKPYSMREHRRDDGAIEYRHYLSDVFNGLVAVGFSIQHVCEAPCHLRSNPIAEAGSWEHILAHIPWLFAIVARKQQESLC